MKEFKIRSDYEKLMECSKWREEIPYIKFPSDWEVRIIPPSVGAVIRFNVRKGSNWVSIYLDCYDNLGSMGQPYWELYPHNGDTFRCFINETDNLLKAI